MNKVFEVTVGPGQDIKKKITEYVIRQNWSDVYISGAVGSVTEMAFRTPVSDRLPLKTHVDTVPGAAEVLSFTGEVMRQERMDPALREIYPDKDCPLFVHIHISCAYSGGEVRGGGLAEGKGFRSLRVFLIPLGETDKKAMG